eukprot:1150478-Pelagomonas_calceolata.AAC.17
MLGAAFRNVLSQIKAVALLVSGQCRPTKKDKKKTKTTQAEDTLPTSFEEKETHWHRRSMSPFHHEAIKQRTLMGIWRVTGSTRLQNLAVRSIIVANGTPSGMILRVKWLPTMRSFQLAPGSAVAKRCSQAGLILRVDAGSLP